MKLQIGTIYRYSSDKIKMDSSLPIADGLPNYFHYTADPLNPQYKMVKLDSGINPIKLTTGPDNIKRRSAIVISSSPHKYGTKQTPWEDTFSPDHGYVTYYGDNKTYAKRPENVSGNKRLLDAYRVHASPLKNERELYGTPIIFFKRVTYDNRLKGNLLFQGFGIIESVELVTQYDSEGNYFSNYVFDLCVFSMKHENEQFNWQWINDRRNSCMTVKETMKNAPTAWKTWVKEGSAHISAIRRNVSALSLVKKADQLLVNRPKEARILDSIYNYFNDNKHRFEMLAMCVAEYVFQEPGIRLTRGWITQKSADGGIDFVMRMDIGTGLSGTKIVILGQAKCTKPDASISGQDIARTVARLKRGWIGVFVTTSFYTPNVQQEVIDDQYPIMLINGKKIAETVSKILYRDGITLMQYLQKLDDEYKDIVKNKRADEILKI